MKNKITQFPKQPKTKSNDDEFSLIAEFLQNVDENNDRTKALWFGEWCHKVRQFGKSKNMYR